jgi:hypothetical protein
MRARALFFFLLACILSLAIGAWYGTTEVLGGTQKVICQLLTPIPRFTNLQQHYYAERCRAELGLRLAPQNARPAAVSLGEAQPAFDDSSTNRPRYNFNAALETPLTIDQQRSVSDGAVTVEDDAVVLDTTDGFASIAIPLAVAESGLTFVKFDLEFTGSPETTPSVVEFYANDISLGLFVQPSAGRPFIGGLVPFFSTPGYHTLSIALNPYTNPHTNPLSSVRISNIRTVFLPEE